MSDKIKIQKCPKCKDLPQMVDNQYVGYRQITVTQQELDDALGCIECDTCGTLLFPEAEIKKEEKLVEQVVKSSRKKSKKVAIICKNDHIEEDGFCTQCGTNHFGGERPEHPMGGPTVGLGKKAPKANKEVVFHTHVHLWQYDW